MAYRIYDKTALDKASGNFTLLLDVSKFYDVKNPDGTSPNASLEVKCDTVRNALSLLNTFRESKGFQEIILEQSLADLSEINSEVEELLSRITDGDDPQWSEVTPHYLKYMKENKDWTTLEVTASAVNEEDKEISADFILHAPGYYVMNWAIDEIVSPKRLSSFAASFMPLADDDDDYEDDEYSRYF
jgi:hypothetical protein